MGISGVDRAAEVGLLGFSATKKVAKLSDKTVKVADAFTAVPSAVLEVNVAFKVLKIINGMLTLPKLYKNAVAIFTSIDIKGRLVAVWGVIKSVKKVVGAVETVFGYLYKLEVISKVSLAWTVITGYIFMPVSVIGTIISGVQLKQKITYLSGFHAQVKASKHKPHTLCRLLNNEQQALRKMSVITGACPLEARLSNILKHLKSSNKAIRIKAKRESQFLAKKIVDRGAEQAGIAATKTTLATIGVGMTVLSLACPPAAVGLTIAGLVVTVVSVATYFYSKFVPKGDILDTEKRMLFGHIYKHIRTMQAAAAS